MALDAPLPTGTVTFAFTDIESNTARWQRDGEAVREAVQRHDAILQKTIARHGGHVFKTVGNAFCAAFTRPEDAVSAMSTAQQRLAGEDFSQIGGLRVRAAVHTGTADERDGDYFGPTLNRVARLLAAGHGGQVLLSKAAAELVKADLPPQHALRDLGEHRLKDLLQPERVHQLLAPDLIADFPPLRSLERVSNNLPTQMTSFVGRETEIGEIAEVVARHRLVTLVGSGGVGKTRLSLQVAAALVDDFSDGVWFVELAPLVKPEYVPTTVAKALGIGLGAEGDPIENLARALKNKRMLIVFDNCEHLIEEAAHLISAILDAAPMVKVLSSSRQALSVAGEAMYRVPPLSASTGFALFVERAQAASTAFSATEESAPVIAEICQRLDGIPLAIELAAARIKMLGVRQLSHRLDARFRLLTGGGRNVLPRQQTLRALIDWSHDLLDEHERVLLRRLGMFVSGFTLEGAAAVGSDGHVDDLDAFDVLASLVDKSLVMTEPHDDALRYRLLESTRAYALEKLEAAGERDLIASRHLQFLRDYFAELWELTQRTARSVELGAALEIELEDLRSALDGALLSGAVADGASLLASIGGRWRLAGLQAEGITRLEGYLAELSPDEPRLRSRLLISLSILLGEAGSRVQALEAATLAVEHARASVDSSTLALALHRYAYDAMILGRRDDAELALAEAEAIPGASPNFRMVLLQARANLLSVRGDMDAAATILEQLRDKCRSLGDRTNEHIATRDLAEVEHRRGRTQRSIAVVRELLPATRSDSNKPRLGLLLQNLAGYLVASDDAAGAIAVATEAIAIHAERDPRHVLVAAAIEHLALALTLAGNPARAAILEGYADAALAEHRFVREFTEQTTYDSLGNHLRNALPAEELAHLLAKGAALAPEAAITLALESP
jgi:predicted ATPase/class 3 adenylate cyclase